MPKRILNNDRIENKARERREELAARRSIQAGPEGLSPERGREGTPYHRFRDGHHFERRDPARKLPGQLAGSNPDPPQQPRQCVRIEQVHRDPIFDSHDINVQAQAAMGVRTGEPYVDIDLTLSPPPAPPYQRANHPNPTMDVIDTKPSHVKLWFQVFADIPQSKAEKQAGLAQKYTDLTSNPPFNAIIQIHGAKLIDIKENVFNACADYKKVCGEILRDANHKGRLAFKGYVAGRGDFLKTALKIIASEAVLDQFKATMNDNRGKEVGFRLYMDNPKTVKRLKSKEDAFDQATLKSHRDSLAPNEVDMLELKGIGVDKVWQDARVKLMRQFGCVSIGGRECMGCINPGNSTEAVRLSHSMMDIWAHDLVDGTNGATEMMPPIKRPEFRFKPIHEPVRRPPADTTQSTSQIPDFRPESPLSNPVPDFEDYLRFAKIAPDDRVTRDLLEKLNIIEFESFLSASMDVLTLVGLGIPFGTAVRLHDKAPLYRTELKNREKRNR
ncbi:hypothetical protein DFH28DRAFT_1132925 [Melampsora americana]|nr:hypothetical protein DFH28DRAFT_1132925 [Melampsora americana]